MLTAHRRPLPQDHRSQQKRSFGGLYSEKCKQSFINSGNVWLLSLSLLCIFSDTIEQLHLVAPHQKSIFADTYDPKEENDYEQSTIYPSPDLQCKALIELVKDILLLWSIFYFSLIP